MFTPNVLLVKAVGEIFLKSDFVAKRLMEKLKLNVATALKNNNLKFDKIVIQRGRLFVYGDAVVLEKAQEVLCFVFGIHSTALTQEFVVESLNQVAEISSEIGKEFLNKSKTFAVRCKRSGIKDFSSKEVEEQTGGKVLEKLPNLKVNLTKPDKTLFIEVRQKKFYVFVKEKIASEGLPIGSQGNVVFLLSGKKEDFEAGKQLLKRGCNLYVFEKTKNPQNKQTLNLLKQWNSFQELTIYLMDEFDEIVKKRKILAVVDSLTEINEMIKMGNKFNEIPLWHPIAFIDF